MKTSLLVIGIVLLVIGVIGGINYNSKNTACNTTASKVSQIFSPQTTQDCTNAQGMMYFSFLIATAGLALIIVGATVKK